MYFLVSDEPLHIDVTAKELSPDLKTEKDVALEQRENENEEPELDSLKAVLRRFIAAGNFANLILKPEKISNRNRDSYLTCTKSRHILCTF